MRSIGLAALLLVTGTASNGCATIFSGTKQEVRISSDAPETTCVTLGGTLGSWLSYASKASAIAQKIFDILDPVLGPDARADLRKADLNELITLVAMWASEQDLPPELIKGRDYFNALPAVVRDELLGLFSIMDLGVAPRKLKLRRGKAYTVVAWAPGRKARVETIDLRFNWTTLWNILHGGFGFLVDFLTGCWLGLEPAIEFRLPAHN